MKTPFLEAFRNLFKPKKVEVENDQLCRVKWKTHKYSVVYEQSHVMPVSKARGYIEAIRDTHQDYTDYFIDEVSKHD